MQRQAKGDHSEDAHLFHLEALRLRLINFHRIGHLEVFLKLALTLVLLSDLAA